MSTYTQENTENEPKEVVCALFLTVCCVFCVLWLGVCSIRKTMFKWTPDHLAAAPFFEKSAAAYEVAGEADKAKLMYIQAADSQIEVLPLLLFDCCQTKPK